MDTTWIQVFVLTIAECAAPAGKTVCQEREFDLQFLTRADCEVALEQLVTLKDESATVIVDKTRSRCAASAREAQAFASASEVSKASAGTDEWKDPDPSQPPQVPSSVSHQDRLAELPDCEDFDGEGACKMGGIIVEAGHRGERVEVWRRDN
jgi:hypothetical protein